MKISPYLGELEPALVSSRWTSVRPRSCESRALLHDLVHMAIA